MPSETWGGGVLLSEWRRRPPPRQLLRGGCLVGLLLLAAMFTIVRDSRLPLWFSQEGTLPDRCTAEQRSVEAEEAGAPADGGKRVALLFFGLPRSLPFTLPSIHEHVLQPLKDAGYRPTVFVHTYNDSAADAQSHGVSTDAWQALQPFSHLVTYQDDVLEQYRNDIAACLEIGTGWAKDGPEKMQITNTQNWVEQLNSVSEVSGLWEQHFSTHPEEYAAVAFMRPDVQYQDPFPVRVIPDLKEGQVYVPAWSDNGGINDRFSLLHPSSAARWKERLSFTLHHCLDTPIHSETFTKDFADYEGFEVHRQPGFSFFRVRGNGDVCRRDRRVPGYREALQAIRERKEALQSMPCW